MDFGWEEDPLHPPWHAPRATSPRKHRPEAQHPRHGPTKIHGGWVTCPWAGDGSGPSARVEVAQADERALERGRLARQRQQRDAAMQRQQLEDARLVRAYSAAVGEAAEVELLRLTGIDLSYPYTTRDTGAAAASHALAQLRIERRERKPTDLAAAPPRCSRGRATSSPGRSPSVQCAPQPARCAPATATTPCKDRQPAHGPCPFPLALLQRLLT